MRLLARTSGNSTLLPNETMAVSDTLSEVKWKSSHSGLVPTYPRLEGMGREMDTVTHIEQMNKKQEHVNSAALFHVALTQRESLLQ